MLEKTKRQLTGRTCYETNIGQRRIFRAGDPADPVAAAAGRAGSCCAGGYCALDRGRRAGNTLEGSRLGAGDRRFGNGSPAGRRHGAAAPDGRLSNLRRAVGNAAGIRIGGAEGAGRRRAYLYGKAPSLRKARKRRRLLRQRLLSGVAERGGAAGKIRRGF